VKRAAETIAALDAAAEERLARVSLAFEPRPGSRMPALDQLRAETPPGCCLVCDEPLPDGHRTLCDDPECEAVYHEIYRAERSANEQRAKEERAP